jgi:hypothetical protein
MEKEKGEHYRALVQDLVKYYLNNPFPKGNYDQMMFQTLCKACFNLKNLHKNAKKPENKEFKDLVGVFVIFEKGMEDFFSTKQYS